MAIEINKKSYTKIYMVGIKGIAMSALAAVLKDNNCQVWGSDVAEEFPSSEVLKKLNIRPFLGFSKRHLEQVKPNLVIYTGAHGGKANIEVKYARSLNLLTLPHSQALGLIMNPYKQASVTGCHGKTTTASMLATIAVSGGLKPGYAIGCGLINPLGIPGSAGGSGRGWFIAEADEYVTDPQHDLTPRFMWQNPDILVLNNIDFDHPDVYKNIDSIRTVYQNFADKLKSNGILITNGDDRYCRKLTSKSDIIYIGTSRADYEITGIEYGNVETRFKLRDKNQKIYQFKLKVPGIHNIFNASMAAVAARHMGLPWEQIAHGLGEFLGSKRRLEIIGRVKDVLFYDDYAHHPNEIKSSISALKNRWPDRQIITVFQPHTYSRTYRLLNDFANAFTDVDLPIFMDIYSSKRETDTLGLTGSSLFKQALKYNKQALYLPRQNDIETEIIKSIKKDSLVIFMGAGDIYLLSRKITKSIIKKYGPEGI